MKKLLLPIGVMAIAAQVHAQAPHAIPYQAAARNSSGVAIAMQPVGVRFSIHDGDATGPVVYSETHLPTTTAQGLFSVQIGQGTPVSGTFASINWGVNSKYLQVEIDPAGGTTYTDMGTTQLMSVPYALYAETTGSGGEGQWTTSGSHIYNGNTGNVGIGTTTPAAKLEVQNGSVLFSAPALGYPGPDAPHTDPPISLSGRRMMWYPDKLAFRTGSLITLTDSWDNMGYASIASGIDVTASGLASVAFGQNTTASGYVSFAMGDGSSATGFRSVAFHGNASGSGSFAVNGIASGASSIALGGNAGGSGSLAMRGGNASGELSFASGMAAYASGSYADAIGFNVESSGNYSTAMGNHVSTNGKEGSFAIGDYSGGYTNNDNDNQMMMRFAGGYKLYSNNGATEGIHIAPTGVAKYLTDVTTHFDDRSLVDKAYVDAAVSSGTGWTVAGDNIHNSNTGKVGIGTTTPAARLHVADSSVVFATGYDPELITPGAPPVSGGAAV